VVFKKKKKKNPVDGDKKNAKQGPTDAGTGANAAKHECGAVYDRRRRTTTAE